mgnify:FL=1
MITIRKEGKEISPFEIIDECVEFIKFLDLYDLRKIAYYQRAGNLKSIHLKELTESLAKTLKDVELADIIIQIYNIIMSLNPDNTPKYTKENQNYFDHLGNIITIELDNKRNTLAKLASLAVAISFITDDIAMKYGMPVHYFYSITHSLFPSIDLNYNWIAIIIYKEGDLECYPFPDYKAELTKFKKSLVELKNARFIRDCFLGYMLVLDNSTTDASTMIKLSLPSSNYKMITSETLKNVIFDIFEE